LVGVFVGVFVWCLWMCTCVVGGDVECGCFWFRVGWYWLLLFVLFLGFSLLPSPTLTASYRLQKP